MGMFSSTTFNSLDDLFLQQIEDLYDAEKRIAEALGKMRDAAHNPQLKQAFEQHMAETKGQAQRLEQVFDLINKKPERETCEAAKGLIKEGSEMISATGDNDVKDAGLIAAAQRVEHYEMAGYGTARTFARRLGRDEDCELLQATLDEEAKTDERLTMLAENGINRQAQKK